MGFLARLLLLNEQGKQEERRLANAIERERLALERERAAFERERLLALRETPQSVPAETLWLENEAASFLRVSERWLRDSDVPKVKLEGRGKGGRAMIRYAPDEVRAYAQARLTHQLTKHEPPKPQRRK